MPKAPRLDRKRNDTPDFNGEPENMSRAPASARAAAPVLCLDEFLDMEDPRVRKTVEDACAGLCALGVTVLFATHIMEHVEGMAVSVQRRAAAMADGPGRGVCCKVVAFSQGRVTGVSSLEDSSYMQWKKSDSAEREARRVI